jgi:hypothetical protein
MEAFMKKTRFALLFAAALALAVPAQAFASGGAGGLMFGAQVPQWNPDWMPSVPSGMPVMGFFGGYGYGVDHHGAITGGFGMCIFDANGTYAFLDDGESLSYIPSDALIGGVGGLISGQRIIGIGGLTLDFLVKLGAGGASLNGYDYVIGYLEGELDLGVEVFPWMRLGAFVGYNYMYLWNASGFGADGQSFSPVLGLNLTWGKF